MDQLCQASPKEKQQLSENLFAGRKERTTLGSGVVRYHTSRPAKPLSAFFEHQRLQAGHGPMVALVLSFVIFGSP